jgi:hypothetical protein
MLRQQGAGAGREDHHGPSVVTSDTAPVLKV